MATLDCKTSDNSSSDFTKLQVFNINNTEISDDNTENDIPLQSSWTFWLDKAVRGRTVDEYKKNLKKVYTVDTIQKFWAVYNNIPKVCEIQNKYSYHLMRDERLPLWEETDNQKGGTWRFRCHKNDTETVWKEVVLGAIGEQFNKYIHKNDEICGVTVSVRDRDDLIQIWNVDADLANSATIIPAVVELLPKINFLGQFYKPHQLNYAYERH
ncbi:GSCOCG00013519001-RA-CDS [Cotesia congregata]|uniref:Similar to EIF4E3: Eukaryotic translation initiation factor 4E type 3 (Homo sapiens) n=1 Tax=Cotesia congregata TaxID=51543 RepID=A0A8J2EEC5_COTCN|nr:GSCOCG00013519001-RA-CDS [Cotesia congregata]CAG5076007.1 Similar to EIF4E3: Eukaryotic translation initiation factor 4E type 3 (Homo sapiens) [Cotesia congregata]